MRRRYFSLLFCTITIIGAVAMAALLYTAWVRAAPTERMSFKGHSGEVTSLAFSPDGRILASGSHDNTVKLWDCTTGQANITVEHRLVQAVAFSPDGKTLASASRDGPLHLFDLETQKVRAVLREHTPQRLAFCPDGRTLAFDENPRPFENPKIVLLDPATGKIRNTLSGHSKPGIAVGISCLTFSPDGKRLASGSSEEQTVKIWDTESGVELKRLRKPWHTVRAIAFSPDGKTLASAASDITLWDVGTGAKLKVIDTNQGDIRSLAYSPDGRLLAWGGLDRTVRVCESSGGSPPSVLGKHQETIWAVAFSPDGSTVASGGMDQRILLWDVPPH